MSNTDFDEFFRDKLADHVSPVPPDMWNRIKPGSKKRPGFAWWRNAGFVVILLAFIAGGYRFYQSSSNSEAIIPAVEVNSLAATNNSGIPAASTPRNNPQRTSATGKAQSTHIGKNKAGNLLLPPGSAAGVSATTSLKSVPVAAGSNHFTTNSRRNPALNFKRFSQAKSGAPLSNTFQPNAGLSTSVQADQRLLYGELSGERLVFSTRKLALLSEEQKKYNLSCFVRCPTNNPSRNRPVFVELYVSPDYASKKVSGRDSANSEFLRRKDSTESFRSAFTAGIRLSKKFGNNTVLKTGLQYSQINEKFSYRSENERRTTTVITIRTVIRAPGDTIFVRDTSMVEQIGYRITKNINKYRSIDLPLILSYEWGNDNLRLAVNGGVIFNLRSWQEGQMLNTKMVAEPFNKSPGLVFKSNIGIGLVAGASIFKRISPNLEVFAEPYFRYNLSDMTNTQPPFRQKFNVAGLNLGLRYKLSRNNALSGR